MSPLFSQMSPLFQEPWDIVPSYEISRQNTVIEYLNNVSNLRLLHFEFQVLAEDSHEVWLPTRNSTTLGFRRYKQSRDLRVINYIMALLMLTVRNSQCLSTRFSQNALQTYKNLNTLISLLIFDSVEKKNHNGSIITPKF